MDNGGERVPREADDEVPEEEDEEEDAPEEDFNYDEDEFEDYDDDDFEEEPEEEEEEEEEEAENDVKMDSGNYDDRRSLMERARMEQGLNSTEFQQSYNRVTHPVLLRTSLKNHVEIQLNMPLRR